MCLLGNELFSDIHSDAYQLANAVELFHNFTLVHDDMMDAAHIRRGKTTVHIKYGDNTALLVGDVMMIRAYEYIQKFSLRIYLKFYKFLIPPRRRFVKGSNWIWILKKWKE